MTSITNKSEQVHIDLAPEKIMARLIANYKKTKNTDPCVAAYLTKNKAAFIKNIKPLIPAANQSTYKFHLMNSNTQLANAFRRVLSSELPFRYFHCKDEMDIDTDDPKLARSREYIIQKINSIPLDQEAAEKIDREKVTKLQFVLEDENTDQHTLSIYDKVITTASINLYEMADGGKWTKVADNQKYFKFCQTTRIAQLKKAKKLRIKIYLNIDDSFNYHAISRGSYTYRPLEFKEPFPASYTVHPKNYELSITNNRYTKCKWYTNKIFMILKERLESILEDFQEASKDGNVPYTSKKLRIEKLTGDEYKYKYKLFGETQTIGNLMAWYTFKMDETISLCNCGNDHPKDPYIVLNIIHKDHVSHFIKGTKKAIDDVKRVISQI
jgi:DNA-directed RNA polymerase subunit L